MLVSLVRFQSSAPTFSHACHRGRELRLAGHDSHVPPEGLSEGWQAKAKVACSFDSDLQPGLSQGYLVARFPTYSPCSFRNADRPAVAKHSRATRAAIVAQTIFA